MSTFLQMQTEAYYHLNDDSQVRYNLTMVKTFLNNAYRFYHNKLVGAGCKRILATPGSLDLSAGTQEVALPSDFYYIYKLSRVRSDTRIPLMYKSNLEAATVTDGAATGDGYFPTYDVQGTNLILNPIPEADETGALYLEYWPTITEMSGDSDSTASGFSSQWHPMLPLKAAIMLKSIREEEETANISRELSIYEMDFNKYISSITKQRKKVTRFSLGG